MPPSITNLPTAHWRPTVSEQNNNDWLKRLLKGLLIMVVVLLAIVVVGFGLLVGFCALGNRH